MKLHKDCLVEKVASKDACRRAINAPYLDIDEQRKAHVIATNGATLVKIPVEIEEGDVAGYLPVVALKEARKLHKSDEAVNLSCNGSAKLINGATYPREDLERFPNWRQVMPKEEGKTVLALDARLLFELAQALGTEGVVLTFDAGSPIAVRATSTKGVEPASLDARGVLMPIRL